MCLCVCVRKEPRHTLLRRTTSLDITSPYKGRWLAAVGVLHLLTVGGMLIESAEVLLCIRGVIRRGHNSQNSVYMDRVMCGDHTALEATGDDDRVLRALTKYRLAAVEV